VRKKFALTLSLLVSLFATPPVVLACAFDIETYFTWTTHPDVPLTKFSQGQLGILEGSYARSYLFTAYRYLSGKPLTKEEQDGALQLWNDRLTTMDYGCNTDTDVWLKARAMVPGVKKIENISTDKSIPDPDNWQYFCNCQGDSFKKAAETLQALVTKYGAGSLQVKEWLSAQDQVFSNCGDNLVDGKAQPGTIPPALPATADAALLQDRNYQIAAANFYAGNFEEARKQFEAIAADSASPWHKISGYLAVRAMIRQATLAKESNKTLLAEAQQRIERLAANPDYANMATDIDALASYVAGRLDPGAHLHKLVEQPYTSATLGEITKTIDTLAESGYDQTATEWTKLPDSLRSPDIVDWVMTYKSDLKEAKQHSYEMWQKTRALPWLVAAASSADAEDPNASAIIAAASKEVSGPARWTLFYHVNRLNLDMGKNDQVRADLDRILNAPPADLPLGGLNELKTQRLPLSRSVAEFVKFGAQKPLCVCSNGGTTEVPDDIDQITKSGKSESLALMFTPEAGSVLINRLPLSVLKKVAQDPALPKDLKNNVAWTSWVRAVLIGDDPAARELAQVARTLNPAKTALFDRYIAATTSEDRRFAAAMLMLRFSSAVPNATWGNLSEDGYGDASGWWWGESPAQESAVTGMEGEPVETFDPLFLTAAEKAQAKAQIAKLKTVAAAPNWFAKIVLPYAKAHPTDPRVPEALHRFVKATRYGSTDDATKTYSKQAFTVLHSKYKGNTWTKQTPYYY
jgi:hypothetical protein